jgi:hypothetical protein
MLTGGANMGFAVYTMRSLSGFDSISDTRKREYVSAFAEKSKKEIDAIATLSKEEKEQHKKRIDAISAGLASEASTMEMRSAVSQTLGVIGTINAKKKAKAEDVAFVSPIMPVTYKPDKVERPMAASTAPMSAPAAVSKKEEPASVSVARNEAPMSTRVGKIEVAGRVYATTPVYNSLEDEDKERVVRILALKPEFTLQQAITQMNDEQAIRRKARKIAKAQEPSEPEEDDETSSESSGQAGGPAKIRFAAHKAHEKHEDKKQHSKKSSDLLSQRELDKIKKIQQKHPGMSREEALEIVRKRGE